MERWVDGCMDEFLGKGMTEIYHPFKRNSCAFSIQAHGLFQRKKKMVGEVTACKSENYLSIPEYTKDSVVLTSLQT